MKKTLKKKIIHKHTHARRIKRKYNKGALGAGMAYTILTLLVVFSAAFLMIGNLAPQVADPVNGQRVVVLTITPEGAKNNLQLYTFPGATYTPTPTPTPTPEPTSPPQPPGNGNDNGDGGNHSAPEGNGNNSGSSGVGAL